MDGESGVCRTAEKSGVGRATKIQSVSAQRPGDQEGSGEDPEAGVAGREVGGEGFLGRPGLWASV